MRLWSSGKIPTTSVRRPISLSKRSSGLVERSLVQCSVAASRRESGRRGSRSRTPDADRAVARRRGGLDFLGFHHRLVRGDTPASRHLCFLARWPSRQAMRRARDRIREITDRRRLLLPVEEVVQDVNRFLRGWAGYFRYGNSANAF